MKKKYYITKLIKKNINKIFFWDNSIILKYGSFVGNIDLFLMTRLLLQLFLIIVSLGRDHYWLVSHLEFKEFSE